MHFSSEVEPPSSRGAEGGLGWMLGPLWTKEHGKNGIVSLHVGTSSRQNLNLLLSEVWVYPGAAFVAAFILFYFIFFPSSPSQSVLEVFPARPRPLGLPKSQIIPNLMDTAGSQCSFQSKIRIWGTWELLQEGGDCGNTPRASLARPIPPAQGRKV